MTIGLKSLIALLLAIAAVALGAWRGAFDAEHFAHLSAGAAFAIGLFASACTALVGFGWRPRSRSRTALALQARPALVEDAPAARELPALAQRALLASVFATIALGTLGNEAAARIANLPADLSKPSRSEYCPSEEELAAAEKAALEAEEDEPQPEPQQVEQAGCALVKRAYALGYAKTLGSCAPKVVAPKPKAKTKVAAIREVCERRQLDEPFLHYTARKVVETMSGAAPVDALGHRVDAIKTRIDFARDLMADIKHAITGTPHASHHLWIDLADPHPSSWSHIFTGEVPCMSRFANLPLWPAWAAGTPPGLVFEHVFGQLLFATRFGTPASCSDYTIHWGSAPDTCTKLAADPAGFLADAGATASIGAVLDRRKRQLALRAMATALGEAPTLPEPPAPQQVTSVSCLMFDGARPAVAKTITVDGETILMRELHAPPIVASGGGPIAVYSALAYLMSGTRYSGPADAKVDGALATDAPAPDGEPPPTPAPPPPPTPKAAPPIGTEFSLLSLEPLVDADPFLTGAAPLDDPAVADVYPIEHHLHGFIDAFRRVYLPQRGRL